MRRGIRSSTLLIWGAKQIGTLTGRRVPPPPFKAGRSFVKSENEREERAAMGVQEGLDQNSET